MSSSEKEEGEEEDEDVVDGEPITVLSVLRHGIGLATDLYDLTIINAIRPELEFCYGPMSDGMNGAITAATSAGAMVGQLGFGYAADALGRRGTFLATASLLCFSALGCATAHGFGGFSIYQVLLAWRLLLGIGVGGEYPLSMAVTAESAGAERSATSMALTYMMFQVGQLLAPIVVLSCIYLDVSQEATWRFSFSVGAILAAIGALLRASTMSESKAWLEARAKAKTSATSLGGGGGGALRAVAMPLLGTASTYFVYDVVSWGVGSYTSSIFESSTRAGTMWYMLLINFMATPGFILTLWMGRFGRRAYQLAGFLGMAACFFAVSAAFGRAPQIVLVLIFGFQKIFDSAGPGATTFIIPGEIFPTAVRASCHGMSSASGKLGAFVGMFFFPAVEHRIGFKGTLLLGGVLLLLGALLTLLLTPPYTERTLLRLQAATKEDLSRTSEILWAKDSDDEDGESTDAAGLSAVASSGSSSEDDA